MADSRASPRAKERRGSAKGWTVDKRVRVFGDERGTGRHLHFVYGSAGQLLSMRAGGDRRRIRGGHTSLQSDPKHPAAYWATSRERAKKLIAVDISPRLSPGPSSSPTSVARPFVERRFQFASR